MTVEPAAGPQGKRTRVIADLDTLKAISDPLRVRILDALERPRSVTETAAVLDEPRSRLYYHFKILERHDLIAVVDTRVVSGIVERWYRATADTYEIAPALSPTLLATSGALASVFDEVRAGVEAAIDQAPGGEAGDRAVLRRTDVRLTRAGHRELLRRIDELVDEFEPSPGGPDARGFGLFVTLYARVEETDG